MTRAYNERMECPHCGKEVTIETAFGRWVRNHPELRSKVGYTANDHDLRWHKFHTEKGRAFQFMMNIEIKTNGADLTESQHDTILIENQLIRNRRQTPTKELRYQYGTGPCRVYSKMNRCRVWVRHFGNHLLQFSGQGPEDSEWIRWDRMKIDVEKLLAILKFELDPDTLRPMDCRSHHRRMAWVGKLL